MIAGSTKWTTLLGHVSLIAVLSSGNIVNAYTWPNPLLEELDGQLHDRQGYNSRTLPSGMQPDCSAFVEGPQAGRANVADWIRTVSFESQSFRAFTVLNMQYRHIMTSRPITSPMVAEDWMPLFGLRRTGLRYAPLLQEKTVRFMSFYIFTECRKWVPKHYRVLGRCFQPLLYLYVSPVDRKLPEQYSGQ